MFLVPFERSRNSNPLLHRQRYKKKTFCYPEKFFYRYSLSIIYASQTLLQCYKARDFSGKKQENFTVIVYKIQLKEPRKEPFIYRKLFFRKLNPNSRRSHSICAKIVLLIVILFFLCSKISTIYSKKLLLQYPKNYICKLYVYVNIYALSNFWFRMK